MTHDGQGGADEGPLAAAPRQPSPGAGPWAVPPAQPGLWPAPPSHPDTGRVRRGRGLAIGLTAAGVVVVLLAALVWAVRPRQPDLSAFDEAVNALAVTPGATVTTTSRDGAVVAEARVASTGETTGRLRVDGSDYDLLVVGAQSYVRSSDGRLPGGPIGAIADAATADLEASLLAGRWVAFDLGTLNPSWQQPPSPAGLAYRLRAALADFDTVTLPDEPGPLVAGQPTRVALTSVGAVHITTLGPHRVVRVDPTQLTAAGDDAPPSARSAAGAAFGIAHAAMSAALSVEPPADPVPPAEPDPLGGEPDPLGGGPLDLGELDAQQVQEMFADLARETEQLAEAADASLDLAFDGQPSIDCGPEGCTFSGAVLARVRTTGEVRSAQATATLNVSVSVAGTAAGTCTQQLPLPLDTPTPVACSVPQAGPVFVAENERAKAAAIAATPPGRTARWSVAFQALGVVIARADIEVAEVRADLEASREESLCRAGGDGCDDPAVTPSAPAPSPTGLFEADVRALNGTISAQRQGRHVLGDLYNGGGAFNSVREAQIVLDAVKSGQATVLGRTANGHLLVRYEGVTGYNNNVRLGIVNQPTNVFIVKGTSSVSVVPVSPTAVPVP